MSHLSLALLGSFQATMDGESLSGFRTKSVQALLIYLACQAERPLQRDSLLGLIWPGLPQTSAQKNLRQTLYLLRQAIPDVPSKDGTDRVPLLLVDRHTVQMNPEATVRLDVEAFTSLLRGPPANWPEAVALYRGEFLTDFYLPDSSVFEEWVAARREKLRRQALNALATLVDSRLEAGVLDEAEKYARRQLEIDSLRESAHRQLMKILARSGRRRAALSHYEAFSQLLFEELAVEPSAATQALYQAIRSGALDQVVVRAASPVPMSADQETVETPHNLPAQVTPFIGREGELKATADFMASPDVRLVTIVGPGGIGKTRLALEAARAQLDNFENGVRFTSLTRLSSAEEIVPAVAQSLGFSFYEGGTPKQQLLDYLRNKSFLLVMDNYEHLLDGAELASDIVQNAAQVKVLATSREPLRLVEEQLFHLDGLSFNREDAAKEDEAVQLLLERARRVQPELVLEAADSPHITAICRQVDGMPLGLELAAAWADSLSLTEIAAELQQGLDLLETDMRNIPDRHRSMRAVFDVSWERLQPDERQLFA